MSFWDTVGQLAEKAALSTPIVGVFDAARTAARTEDPQDGPDGIRQNAEQFGAAFFKNSANATALQGAGKVLTSGPVSTIMAPLVWTQNQASHGFSTVGAVGGLLSDAGETNIDALWSRKLWSADTWSQAWDASEGVTGGEAIAHDIAGTFSGADRSANGRRWWAGDNEALDDERQNTGFKIASGAMDIISTWYADPTIVGGKAVKAARAGSRIVDAAQADEVAQAIGKVGERSVAERAAGTFATTPEETASRLYHQVAKTDNMDVTEAAAHFKPMLERSGDSAPIIGILGQAGKITDLELQRAVKADALLAAAGSVTARDRLIQQAPQIARALQRASLPPEQFKIVDDLVAGGLSGRALLDATQAWATKANAKELDAYAKDLDAIHTRIGKVEEVGKLGGVEQVGGSVLNTVKSKYRAGMAREFFYAQGPSGRMVRVVHWATGQRMRGVIDTKDAVRGHDELMDVMTRSGLFSGLERQRMSEKWWTASTQEQRSSLAQNLPTFMLARLGEKHGLSKAEMKDLLKQYGDWHAASRTYVTKQMEEARRANLSRIVLEDPATGVPSSIDRFLFETHVADTAPIPDMDVLERLVRHRKDAGTMRDKVRTATASLWNSTEDVNDIWRTLTLGRPGFIARTQFDTQARAMMTIGATRVVANAMKGLGHKLGDTLNGKQVQEVIDSAEDLARRESLTSRAADLRDQAKVLGNGAGARLLARADALEAEAAKPIARTITGRKLVTEEREVLGQKTRAARSDVEARYIQPALHTGQATISDAILRIEGKLKGDLVEDADNWVTVMPEDVRWASSWVRSKDSLMQSVAGRKIVENLDLPNVDLVRLLKSDPAVRDAWREVRDGNPHFDTWLDRAIAQAEWTAPTPAIREALLSGKVLGSADVEKMFKPIGAVTDKEAAAAAARFDQEAGPLGERVAKLEARAKEAERRVAMARRDDTRARHQEFLERTQAKLEKAKAKHDRISQPATVADEHAGLPDRMPVHAPAMDVLNPLKHRKTLMDNIRGFVSWMADTPDTVLGRVPMYTERYFRHFDELGQRELARSGEIGPEAKAAIEKVARHRAIQDTRQVMYDTARYTGAHDRAARLMFAFLGAWEDSMRAWGRLFYDDPSRIGKLGKIWYAPERGGMIVDENGDRVRPGDDVREKWITIPIGWVPGVDVEDFKLRKDSFNSMFQGEVPWAPGFGPVAQIPVTQLVAHTFPELADPNYEISGVPVGKNPLLRQMFGFGLPKTGVGVGGAVGSAAGQLVPGWMKRAQQMVTGDGQQFNDAYAMGLNAALLKARAEGKDVNTKAVQEWADERARKTARSMMFLEFVSNWGLGLSGEGSTKADFYRQRYREMLASGKTQKDFLAQFPEAAGLEWSFSENQTGINATLKVEDRSRKFKRDIQKNPEYGWFYVGSDNLGGEFSSAVYSAQFGREATPGSGETWRTRQNSAEIRQQTQAALGWDSYNKISEMINLELEKRGLHSVSQKGAEDLADIKREFKDNLGAENPEWFKDYNSFDPGKLQTFLDQVAKPALADGRLKSRPDVKALGDYLALREEAMNLANQNGYSLGSKQAAPLRAVLAEAGAALAAENLGFSQTWNRMLQREVEE